MPIIQWQLACWMMSMEAAARTVCLFWAPPGPVRRVTVSAPALTADVERHWAAILRPLGNPD